MATLGAGRSVDVAAAQLIVRESGGLVAFTAYEDPLGGAARPRRALAGRGRAHGDRARRARDAAIISGVIDWNLVRRIAEAIAGEGGGASAPPGDLAAIARRLAGRA